MANIKDIKLDLADLLLDTVKRFEEYYEDEDVLRDMRNLAYRIGDDKNFPDDELLHKAKQLAEKSHGYLFSGGLIEHLNDWRSNFTKALHAQAEESKSFDKIPEPMQPTVTKQTEPVRSVSARQSSAPQLSTQTAAQVHTDAKLKAFFEALRTDHNVMQQQARMVAANPNFTLDDLQKEFAQYGLNPENYKEYIKYLTEEFNKRKVTENKNISQVKPADKPKIINSAQPSQRTVKEPPVAHKAAQLAAEPTNMDKPTNQDQFEYEKSIAWERYTHALDHIDTQIATRRRYREPFTDLERNQEAVQAEYRETLRQLAQKYGIQQSDKAAGFRKDRLPRQTRDM